MFVWLLKSCGTSQMPSTLVNYSCAWWITEPSRILFKELVAYFPRKYPVPTYYLLITTGNYLIYYKLSCIYRVRWVTKKKKKMPQRPCDLLSLWSHDDGWRDEVMKQKKRPRSLPLTPASPFSLHPSMRRSLYVFVALSVCCSHSQWWERGKMK